MDAINVLIFDLDNTLINYGGVTKQTWLLTCQKLVENYALSIDALNLALKIVEINNALWEDEEKRPKGNFSFIDIRTSIVKEALQYFAIDNEEYVSFLVQNYAYYKHVAVYMFEDVPETLQELKRRGYRIALLTNGDAATQREKIARFKLDAYIEEIFIEGEQGVGKPEKAAYENILNTYQVKACNACMIGDHYLWEVVAPIQYGMHAIWVNRGNLGLQGNEEIKPDFTIQEIHELLSIFK